jgi:hypothetical protein
MLHATIRAKGGVIFARLDKRSVSQGWTTVSFTGLKFSLKFEFTGKARATDRSCSAIFLDLFGDRSSTTRPESKVI